MRRYAVCDGPFENPHLVRGILQRNPDLVVTAGTFRLEPSEVWCQGGDAVLDRDGNEAQLFARGD